MYVFLDVIMIVILQLLITLKSPIKLQTIFVNLMQHLQLYFLEFETIVLNMIVVDHYFGMLDMDF